MELGQQMKKNRMGIIIGAVILILLISILILINIQKNNNESDDFNEFQTEHSETPELESEIEIDNDKKSGYILIGESHIVVTDGQGYSMLGSKLEGVNPGENLFFVHTSLDPVMGTYDWFCGDGTNRIKEIKEEHTEITDWAIISMHGTSMCTVENITEQYINTYTLWINELFKDDSVYIVSVPPLDEAEWLVRHPEIGPRYNEDIIKFNNEMQEAFPQNYLDYYDWYLENGVFQDEIHYTGESYRNLFDEVISHTEEYQNK